MKTTRGRKVGSKNKTFRYVPLQTLIDVFKPEYPIPVKREIADLVLPLDVENTEEPEETLPIIRHAPGEE